MNKNTDSNGVKEELPGGETAPRGKHT